MVTSIAFVTSIILFTRISNMRLLKVVRSQMSVTTQKPFSCKRISYFYAFFMPWSMHLFGTLLKPEYEGDDYLFGAVSVKVFRNETERSLAAESFLKFWAFPVVLKYHFYVFSDAN